MRKMKKINGWLIVRFNDREKRIYVGVIGSYGVIDAELYTGDLDMDRGAMEYDNAETLAEAVELARGLPSEEDLNDEQMTFTLVAEGAESFREERIEPQALIVAEENRLRTQVGSSFYKDVDERTAAHELYGFKTALNQLGLLGDDDTPVNPHHFGTAPNPLPRQPEDLLAYVCDRLCKHRDARQSEEEPEDICEKCALTQLYDEASGADRRKLPQKTGFRHAPEKGGINPAALFELGLKLEQSCPKNDCTIYLNIFRQAREADEALSILAGYAKTVVERDFLKLLRELERMYLTTPAVRIYRNQNPLKAPGWEAGCGGWVERLVSEFGIGLDGQLFSSEELLKHTGERVLVRKTTQGVEARTGPGGELIGMLKPVGACRPYKITDIPEEYISGPYRPGGKGGYTAESMAGSEKEPPVGQTAPGGSGSQILPYRPEDKMQERLAMVDALRTENGK